MISPKSFDCFADHYDKAISLERSPDFFLKHLPLRRDRALDVGCGSGILASTLAPLFGEVIGIDISEPMLRIANAKRQAPNITYLLCDASDFKASEPFDAIVSHTTFHHFDNLQRVLESLIGHLRPGGRLIVIDCVARHSPPLPKWSILYRINAAVRFPFDLVHRGRSAAKTLWDFRTSGAWIAHLQSDRYLSPRQFRAFYSAALPGAEIHVLGPFMGVVWTSPTP